MDGVANRLRPECAVDEEVGDPAGAQAEAEPAAIFEPALIAHGRHHEAVAGHGSDDAGMRRKGLRPAAIDVALDRGREQVGPLAADLDEAGAIGPAAHRGAERIERGGGIGIAADMLPELPELDVAG